MSYQSVTVTLLDQSNDPIEGAKVSLTSYNSGALFGTQTTDANGEAAFVLCVAPGLVLVSLELESHLFNPTAFTVTDENVDAEDYVPQEYTVSATSLGTSAESPLYSQCLIFGTLLNSTGRPLENTPVILSTIGQNRSGLVGVGGDQPVTSPMALAIANDRREVRTNPNSGYWEVMAMVGSYVRLEIPAIHFEIEFRVPNKATMHFSDARPWSSGSAKPNTGSPFGHGQ